MTDRPIRALIADDEALARKFIRRMLKENRDFEIIGECSNGKETVAMIRKERPDFVFLDVQMPEMDGLAVLESIGIEQLPEIIFTTAYEQYAIRAFDAHALDYLLKPFDQERLHRAIERVRSELHKSQDRAITHRILDLLSRVEPEFQERVRNNIILSGGGGLIRNLSQTLETALKQVGGGKVTHMQDPVFVGSDGGLALALDAPDSDWEKLTA